MFDFLTQRFSDIFATITGKNYLTQGNIEQALAKVKDALLQADVPLEAVDAFIADVTAQGMGHKVLKGVKPGEQFIKIVHERLQVFLGASDNAPFVLSSPARILVMGLQGSGKTTTIAKIAHWAQEQARLGGKKQRVLLASVDFYRPAALDQLALLAQQGEFSFYRSSEHDVIAAAQDVVNYAQKERYDLLFLDTAGRLHIDVHMLQELRAVADKVRPTHKILVLDAMTGQESLAVARAFDEAVGFDQAVLTKLDSQTRAGAAFAFRYVQKKPIVFMGVGEKISDLELFKPERMANRLLGMGDVLTLVENAEKNIKAPQADRLYKNFMQGSMTLQDFADQMGMVSQLGSLGKIAQYLPSMPGVKVTPEALARADMEVKRFRAIIASMTKKERSEHNILDASRKRRIAQGAGVTVADINTLLKRFEETQQYAKLFKRFFR